jgi:hypothetical protein
VRRDKRETREETRRTRRVESRRDIRDAIRRGEKGGSHIRVLERQSVAVLLKIALIAKGAKYLLL